MDARDWFWLTGLAFVGATLFNVVSCVATSCSGAQKPPGCTPTDEAAIDAWFQAELAKECIAYTPTNNPLSCPKYDEIEREYKKRSEEWYVKCHP